MNEKTELLIPPEPPTMSQIPFYVLFDAKKAKSAICDGDLSEVMVVKWTSDVLLKSVLFKTVVSITCFGGNLPIYWWLVRVNLVVTFGILPQYFGRWYGSVVWIP